MADPRLLQTLDYILNYCDAASIEVLAEAVVRRRRDLSVFSAVGDVPNPHKMSKEITEKINAGVGGGIDMMRNAVQDMIIKILKEHAPELNDRQINELCQAWLPDGIGTPKAAGNIPADALLSMVEQFVAFSHGEMSESVDKKLRKEMGAWPQRYWEAFPPVVRQIITDYLKNKITDKDFRGKIAIALGL